MTPNILLNPTSVALWVSEGNTTPLAGRVTSEACAPLIGPLFPPQLIEARSVTPLWSRRRDVSINFFPAHYARLWALVQAAYGWIWLGRTQYKTFTPFADKLPPVTRFPNFPVLRPSGRGRLIYKTNKKILSGEIIIPLRVAFTIRDAYENKDA